MLVVGCVVLHRSGFLRSSPDFLSVVEAFDPVWDVLAAGRGVLGLEDKFGHDNLPCVVFEALLGLGF